MPAILPPPTSLTGISDWFVAVFIHAVKKLCIMAAVNGRLSVAPELQQRLNDLGEIRHTSVLVRPLAGHDVQYIWQSCPFAYCLHSLHFVGSDVICHG